jgi:hypothetical protein
MRLPNKKALWADFTDKAKYKKTYDKIQYMPHKSSEKSKIVTLPEWLAKVIKREVEIKERELKNHLRYLINKAFESNE